MCCYNISIVLINLKGWGRSFIRNAPVTTLVGKSLHDNPAKQRPSFAMEYFWDDTFNKYPLPASDFVCAYMLIFLKRKAPRNVMNTVNPNNTSMQVSG